MMKDTLFCVLCFYLFHASSSLIIARQNLPLIRLDKSEHDHLFWRPNLARGNIEGNLFKSIVQRSQHLDSISNSIGSAQVLAPRSSIAFQRATAAQDSPPIPPRRSSNTNPKGSPTNAQAPKSVAPTPRVPQPGPKPNPKSVQPNAPAIKPRPTSEKSPPPTILSPKIHSKIQSHSAPTSFSQPRTKSKASCRRSLSGQLTCGLVDIHSSPAPIQIDHLPSQGHSLARYSPSAQTDPASRNEPLDSQGIPRYLTPGGITAGGSCWPAGVCAGATLGSSGGMTASVGSPGAPAGWKTDGKRASAAILALQNNARPANNRIAALEATTHDSNSIPRSQSGRPISREPSGNLEHSDTSTPVHQSSSQFHAARMVPADSNIRQQLISSSLPGSGEISPDDLGYKRPAMGGLHPRSASHGTEFSQ